MLSCPLYLILSAGGPQSYEYCCRIVLLRNAGNSAVHDSLRVSGQALHAGCVYMYYISIGMHSTGMPIIMQLCTLQGTHHIRCECMHSEISVKFQENIFLCVNQINFAAFSVLHWYFGLLTTACTGWVYVCMRCLDLSCFIQQLCELCRGE